MEVVDPTPLLEQLDRRKLARLTKGHKDEETVSCKISKPEPEVLSNTELNMLREVGHIQQPHPETSTPSRIIKSKVQLFGENVDT